MKIRHIQSIADLLNYSDDFGNKAKPKVEILDTGEIWLGLYNKRGEFDGFVLGANMEIASQRICELVNSQIRK